MSIQHLRQAIRYYGARFLLIGPLLFVWGRPKISGQHNIPRTGPVIRAANHLAVSDSFYVVQCARRPVYFLAKSDYFTQPGFRGAVKRSFFSGLGQIPVDRSGGAKSSPAIETATRIVESGGAWGIHPEGTRSTDGKLHKGKTGCVRVAVATGTPIVPIALTGTDHRTLTNFWRSRVTVDILPPLDLSAVRADDQAAIRQATDRLMQTIKAKTGQEYVDVYAQSGSGAK